MEQSVNIPVIGNGDVDTTQIAKKHLDETGVDAVMIGRAALGNPWIVYQTVKYLETGELTRDHPREKIEVCKAKFRSKKRRGYCMKICQLLAGSFLFEG